MESMLYSLHNILSQLVPILGLTVLCVLLVGSIVAISAVFISLICSIVVNMGKE
jgi:hypothetical protein